jgi:antitoxin component YwqK of YwqJK toxin-antitoxin module
MKIVAYFILFTLFACHSSKKGFVSNERNNSNKTVSISTYLVHVKSIEMEKRIIWVDLLGEYSGEYYNTKGVRKIEIKPTIKFGDGITVTERDTFVSRFYSKDYLITNRKLVVYYTNGQIASIEKLSDSCKANDRNLITHFGIFKALRHGECIYYWPNGNLAEQTFFRNGLNDTFSKSWYSNNILASYMHKDTQIFFSENGETTRKECYRKIGNDTLYTILMYWPNGKIKSENYFTAKNCKVPCQTWIAYSEKGKVLSKTEYKPNNQAIEELMFVEPYELIFIENPPCDFKQNLKNGLADILKNEKIDHGGINKMGIIVTNGRVSIDWVSGHVVTELYESLTKNLQKWYCPNDNSLPWHGKKSMTTKEYYTIMFELSNL